MPDVQVNEQLLDNSLCPSRGHGEGYLAIVLPGHADDRVDRLDLRNERQILRFLFSGHRQWIEREVLFSTQHLENVPRWNAAKRIEAVFGQGKAVPPGDHLPRTPMQRHRVCQRAITVKDDGLGME